jgi:hypothetical protein
LRWRKQKWRWDTGPTPFFAYIPAAATFRTRRVAERFLAGVLWFTGVLAVVLLTAAISGSRASVSRPRCAAIRKHWAIGDNDILCSLW